MTVDELHARMSHRELCRWRGLYLAKAAKRIQGQKKKKPETPILLRDVF